MSEISELSIYLQHDRLKGNALFYALKLKYKPHK